MNPEIARNQNYDDHYTNDSENVHSALLPLRDDGARRARIVIATAYIPNNRLLRRAERAPGQ
jgi:hypothetical protein